MQPTVRDAIPLFGQPVYEEDRARGVSHEDAYRAAWRHTKAFLFHLMRMRDPTGEWKPYAPRAQPVVDFHRSMASVRVSTAPARTSKSLSAAAETLPLMAPTEPAFDKMAWIVGPTYETNKEFQYLWIWLVEQREFWPPCIEIERYRNNPGNGDMEIVICWDKKAKPRQRAIFKGMSSTQPSALQGEEVWVSVLSEAAEHPQSIMEKYLATRSRFILLPTTPKPYAEWIKDLCDVHDPNVAWFQFPKEANPYYDHERFREAEARAARLSPTGRSEDYPEFAEQFLGRWVYYTGMVLPFNPVRHVIPNDAIDPATCRVFVSLDYGYDHPSAALLWAVDPRGLLIIFDEVVERKIDSWTLIEKIQRKLDGYGVTPEYYTGDPQRPETAHLLGRLGLHVFDINKRAQRDRAAGHRRLSDLLTSNETGDPQIAGMPGLYVSERCTETIHEWSTLRYKEGAAVDEHSKASFLGRDDCFDAARYGVMTLPDARRERKPKSWLAEALERQRRIRGGPTHAAVLGIRAG